MRRYEARASWVDQGSDDWKWPLYMVGGFILAGIPLGFINPSILSFVLDLIPF